VLLHAVWSGDNSALQSLFEHAAVQLEHRARWANVDGAVSCDRSNWTSVLEFESPFLQERVERTSIACPQPIAWPNFKKGTAACAASSRGDALNTGSPLPRMTKRAIFAETTPLGRERKDVQTVH
jgi:hypothetical protein